jgi:PIG-P
MRSMVSSREWAYLLPAWSLVAVLLTYISYVALNIYNTPSPEELRTITGEQPISCPHREILRAHRSSTPL